MFDTWFCAMVYFMFVYIIVFFYKRGKISLCLNKWFVFFSGIVLYLVMVVVAKCETSLPPFIADVFARYLSDYKSLPNFIIASSIFYFFMNTDIGRNKWINSFSSVAFGVYVIHQVPDFHDYLWFNILHIDYWGYSEYFDLYFVASVLLVYLVCGLLDYYRQVFYEKYFVMTRPTIMLCRLINNLFILKSSNAK